MQKPNSSILAINSGSSSIKFAFYDGLETLQRTIHGTVDRIGLSGTNLTFHNTATNDQERVDISASEEHSAADCLIDWLETLDNFHSLGAVGHRVVHGMQHTEPEVITQELLEELHRLSPFDPDHLPREIQLIELFRKRHPKLTQVACFDTAFHRSMPRVAKLLPIPRRYDAMGIQRYGFHGLSYSFLMEELIRLGDPAAKKGRIILAHLGNGGVLGKLQRNRARARLGFGG